MTPTFLPSRWRLWLVGLLTSTLALTPLTPLHAQTLAAPAAVVPVVPAAAAAPSVMPGLAAPAGPGAGPSSAGTGTPAGAGATSGVPTINGQDGSAQAEGNSGGDPAEPGAGTLRMPAAQSEFQRFVAGATGQRLSRFGQNLFNGGRGFQAIERTPVPADYVVGPGDELHIRAWGAVDIDYRAVVDRNGQISLPRVGTMGVAGLKVSEVEPYVRDQVRRLFTNFSLNVTLGQLRGIQIYVVGQAMRPGTYTLSSLSTLMTAVFASGGPGTNGSMRQIELRRDGKLVTTLDLYEFIVQGSKSRDARLLPGDVIVYKPAGAEVALLGALDTPAIYELRVPDESLQNVLAYGGGLRASTNPQTAQLERIDATRATAPRTVRNLDLAAAAGTPLRDGDIVTLFGVSPQFANAVTLRGNVAAPLRYPFTPGMRISTLIPEREALITPDFYLRKNKLVQFTESRDVAVAGVARELRNLLDEPNWEYAAIERMDADRLTLKLIPFHLGKAVIDRDPQHDLQLQPGDVVTVFARNDMRVPVARQTRLVRVEGEVATPGIYQAAPGETLRQLLQRAGGLTDQAYLYGLELSRASTRQAQSVALADAVRRLEAQLASQSAYLTANLTTADAQAAAALQASQRELRAAQLNRLKTMRPSGRISLELDTRAAGLQDLPDLPLEDGDQVTIPNRPGYVFAVGAVDNSNALVWRPGRRVADYLESAGVQPDADQENIFVVRADGSVSRRGGGGWLGRGGVESLELMPGDTLVVPDKVARETFWTALTRGLKDWSQILYQFGLTAAAIKTLN